MITNSLIDIVSWVLDFIAWILPSQNILPNAFNNAWDFISQSVGMISQLSSIIPQVLTIMGVWIALEGSIFLFKTLVWMYNKIPFKAS